MKRLILTVFLLGGSLSGCSMIPTHEQPDLPVAKSWNEVPGYNPPEMPPVSASIKWEAFFNDPALGQVIRTALNNNKDLRIAALNIEEARALYRIERADLFPSVNGAAGANYQRISDESSITGQGESSEVYTTNLGLARYELDFFGRIRSQSESALNEYLATQEAKDVVQNALVAETANAYLQLLADQKLLSLTQQTIDAQQRTYDLLLQSLNSGISTAQDVARAQTAVETARVNLHQYRRFVEQDKNALMLLMGVPHDESLIPVVSLNDIRLPENLASGLPSESLLARPDVRKAEYDLRARNADIGAARAAFFPSITLTGSYGLASQGLSSLFTSGAAGAWSFLPQITVPIFEGGRNKANLDLAEIRKEKAVVMYEQVIQSAFREVSDELAARVTLTEQLLAQKRLVAAAQKVYDVSEARYKSGIDSFLSVLDAQRELYAFQQNEIAIERQRLSNLVNLYKVLGGGI
ncbi:MAG: efflux transporter outer membrane subunit [Alphaproteobacteria bacterium]|nr:efflux transporter outer membrane subunit [Alphaproteobacteria bacterium]